MPLWYAHYDDVQGFYDYSPFGGWTQPFAKQYSGDGSECSFPVDFNFAPSF